MQSTDRDASQSGIALVEAIVALALLAIGVTVGLTGVDTASAGAKEMVNRGRAQCMVMSEAQYVAAAAWRDPGTNYDVPVPNTFGDVTTATSSATSVTDLEQVTIKVKSVFGTLLVQPVVVLKPKVITGTAASASQVGATC